MLLAAGLALCGAALAQAPSPQELAWVAEHPVVRVGLAQAFAPFYIRDEPNGRVHGFVIELLSLWAQRTGLSYEFKHYGSFAEVRAALRKGEIDMTPFTALESAGSELLATRPAFSGNLVLAARRDVPDISATADFAGRTVAVMGGSSVEAMLIERHPGAALQRYPDAEAALRAVATGRADIYIGYQQEAVYHIERLLLANIELRSNLGAVALGPLVRPGAEPLRQLLDKAIASTTQADRALLAERWLPAASTRVPLPTAHAQLSDPERLWVQRSGHVRLGYDANFAPVTQRGPLGEFQGFGADMARLVAEKAGLVIDQEIGGAFADIYERGRRGELEVVVGMARTVQRRADYDFVGPFLSVPTVLVTRPEDASLLSDTRDIGLRRLALLRGHFLVPELRARHPGIALLELDRQDQVLAAVSEGAADVGLGNLSVVNELIERRFVGKVTVSGVVRNGDSELYFGVPRSNPELTHVMARALEAVNDSETATLRARWLAREVPAGLSWGQVAGVVAPVVLTLGALATLLWLGLRRVRQAHAAELAARQQAELSVAARGRFLAYLTHELRGGLGAVKSGAEMLRASGDPGLRERMLAAIVGSTSGLLDLFERTLHYEQSLQTPLNLQPQRLDLADWWRETLDPARLAAEAKGLRFEVGGEGLVGPAWLDGVRLRQVLQNLLGNALKFTETGQVSVHGSTHGAKGQRWLRVEVADSGPGLSEADRARLFQPYAQGEQGQLRREGAGLGLAISTQIVRAMGGQIEALAAEHGARFVVEVPLAEPPAA